MVRDRHRMQTYDIWWPNDNRGRMWSKFPDICLTVEGKSRKKAQPGNWPDRGYHQSVLTNGRPFTASEGSQAAVLSKAGLPPQTQDRRLQFYQELNRCGSFPLFSAPQSLFSIWTDLKRSQKIQGAPTWRWGEWIWLTGPSGLHRNSPHGLNISFIRFLTRSEIRKSQSPFTPKRR